MTELIVDAIVAITGMPRGQAGFDMDAELLLRERHVLSETSFAEFKVWRLPRVLPASRHNYKYCLAFVVDSICVLRFDNEAGKGDHHHIGDVEMPYGFKSPEQLIADFWAAVEQWRHKP